MIEDGPRHRPGRGWPLLGLLALLIACGPTSSSDSDSAADPAPAPSAQLDPASMATLLDASWMRSAARDPAAVAGLLDSPGGDGWLALFHGDLAAAQAAFDKALPSKRFEPRLGRARVHLARAAAFLEAEQLHLHSGAALARYRRDNPELIRQGQYELPLRALSLMAGGTPQEAAEATRISTRVGIDDPVARVLIVTIQARMQGGDPRGFVAGDLPEPFAARSAFGQDLVGGRMPELVDLAPGKPDVVDKLGTDPETGLDFEAPFFDPLLLRTLARWELLQARTLAAGLAAPGDLVESAVQLGWGGPVPEGFARPALESGVTLPAWAALFGSAAVDATDWRARWARLGGRQPEDTLIARFDAAFPALQIRVGADAPSVDALLRLQTPLSETATAALGEGATPDGTSLVTDLGFARRIVDAVFRSRMDELVLAGQAAQARRLGERALDPNPSQAGDTSGFTRVSHRNDRAFLLRFALCLYAGGRPGLAREYVHPLTRELPELTGTAWVLGQLDAASGIGVRGKISQQ